MIARRLKGAFENDFHCQAEELGAPAWRALSVAPRFRFGYMPPRDEGADTVIRYSPGLLERITRRLNDDELDIYLTVVETIVGAFLMDPARPDDEVIETIENELYEAGALALLAEVEAQALDDGHVAPLP